MAHSDRAHYQVHLPKIDWQSHSSEGETSLMTGLLMDPVSSEGRVTDVGGNGPPAVIDQTCPVWIQYYTNIQNQSIDIKYTGSETMN